MQVTLMVEEEKMEISMNFGRKFSQTQASLGFWNDYWSFRYKLNIIPFEALTILPSILFLVVSVSSFLLFWFLWNHDLRIVLVDHEDFLSELINDCHNRDQNLSWRLIQD